MEWVVSFMFQLLDSQGKTPCIHWRGGWVYFTACVDRVEENLVALSGIELRLLCDPAISLVTVQSVDILSNKN